MSFSGKGKARKAPGRTIYEALHNVFLIFWVDTIATGLSVLNQ